MTEPAEIMHIVNRPLYRVVVIICGTDIDVNIILTSRGRDYARRRAYANHRRIVNDDEAIAEIMHVRDNYIPAILPSEKYSFDA
jgi:poly(A) polymerase Pap1